MFLYDTLSMYYNTCVCFVLQIYGLDIWDLKLFGPPKLVTLILASQKYPSEVYYFEQSLEATTCSNAIPITCNIRSFIGKFHGVKPKHMLYVLNTILIQTNAKFLIYGCYCNS